MNLKCKLGYHDITKRTYYDERGRPYYIEKDCVKCGWHKTIGGIV